MIGKSWALVVALCAYAFSVIGAYGDEASQALAHRGAGELTRNRLAEALALFRQAVAADAQDGDAHFLAGLALNRLGRHAEAVKSLQQAEKLKTQYRDLHLELGWAYLFTRQFQQAVLALTHYESIKPGRGLAQELLGRAYLALGQDEKAEASLREAMRRDARLAPTSNYYLGAIALRKGEGEKGAALLQDVSKNQPSSSVGRSAQTLLDRQRAKDRRWSLSLSAGGGYDSNASQRGTDELVPTEIGRGGTGFGQFSAGGTYDLVRGEADDLTVGYEFAAQVYDDLSEFNSLDHRPFVQYRRKFKDRAALNLNMENHYGEIDEDPSINDVVFSPSLDVKLAEWAVLRLPYTLTWSENFIPVERPLDRDGLSQTLGIVQFLKCERLNMVGRVGYVHIWNRTDGSDYDYDSDSVLVGVNWSLPWKITLDVSYARIWEGYANPNSFTDFSRRRRSDVDLVRVEVVKALNDHVWLRTSYDFAGSDSNVSIYKSDRHAWSAGVILRY